MIGAMRRFNVNSEIEYDPEPDGYRHGREKLAPLLGGTRMAGSLYEVPPGESNCPYHYESNEEWLLVLAGAVTVRHPGGEDVLEAGDIVCFPAGPDGAHKLTNRGDGTVRMLMLSTKDLPAVAVYPDSDKIGVWTEDRRDNILVRRTSGVGYYDGEV
jgi:uncharacterized cupin superfamily protein